jgi:hypothetical protein
MGFPYGEASWSVVDGAMFMGWGSAAPGLYTLIAAAICVGVLVVGQSSETAKAKKFDK